MTRIRHPRTLIVVLLLPLLVAGIGMWALTGRVDRFETVPAAVVNLDKGTEMTVEGKKQFVPFGRLLAGGLTQPSTSTQEGMPDTAGFDWRLTDQDDATEGLQDGSYAAVVVIPENFSEDLATLGTENARQATVQVHTNDASGQLNTLVAAAVGEVSTTAMGTQLTQQYLDGIYVGFADMKKSLGDAADGARQLSDGADQLSTGVGELSTGAGQLADGAQQGADGAGKLADGAHQLSGGISATAEGSRGLSTGLAQLATGTDGVAGGARQLSTGTAALATGATASAGGTRELANGLDELAVGAEQTAGGTHKLANGLDELATGSQELATGAKKLSDGLRGTEEQPGLLAGIDLIRAAVEGNGTPENPGLVAGTKTLADGMNAYAASLDKGYTAIRDGDGSAQNPGLVPTSRKVADSTAELRAKLAGDGSAENPGLSSAADSVHDGACAAAARHPEDADLAALCNQSATLQGYASTVKTALDGDGTAGNRGLVADSRAVSEQTGAALDLFFRGDGTATNPGVIGTAHALADGAEELHKASPRIVEGIVKLHDGVHQFAGGVDQLSDGAGKIAEGARSSATGAEDLAKGMDGIAGGVRESAGGAHALAGGLDVLAGGAQAASGGATQLSQGANQLSAGAHASADGATQLSNGLTQLEGGAGTLAEGSDALADGNRQLADGTRELADGTVQLKDGSGELATGSNELATGLAEGAEQVPTYTEEERARMKTVGAHPVTSFLDRQNAADGAATATFPFVTALALWLGAFAAFLLLPALSHRLINRSMPMWLVVLRSLLPFLGIALVQSILVLGVITALGIAPVSPLSVGVITLAGGAMFAAFHQALLAVLGDRIGRIASIVVMVLQVVALVGIVPVQTAPPVLQWLSGLMPLSLVTEGLVHAALGGSLVSTSGVLGEILIWALGSLAVTVIASRGARRLDRSAQARERFAPAGT